MAHKNDRAMSSLTLSKFFVFVSTQCVESGEVAGVPHNKLFESEADAIRCFTEGVEAGRALVESEIAIIKKPESNLIFSAPYIVSGAIFRVSQELESAESAANWITQQLEEGEDASEYVIRYEGFSIGPNGEKPYDLEDFLSSWC
jgi:hypothetical protein